MEQTSAKNQKLGIILAIIIAVLLVAFVATMAMPFVSYTRTRPPELVGQEETVSLSEYLWLTYKYTDLTGEVLPPLFKAEFDTKFNVTTSIALPLMCFLGSLIAAAIMIVGSKRAFSVLAPFIISFLGLLGYFVAPLVNLSIVNPTMRTVHILILSLVLILSVVSFILYSIPRMKYVAATREKL